MHIIFYIIYYTFKFSFLIITKKFEKFVKLFIKLHLTINEIKWHHRARLETKLSQNILINSQDPLSPNHFSFPQLSRRTRKTFWKNEIASKTQMREMAAVHIERQDGRRYEFAFFSRETWHNNNRDSVFRSVETLRSFPQFWIKSEQAFPNSFLLPFAAVQWTLYDSWIFGLGALNAFTARVNIFTAF